MTLHSSCFGHQLSTQLYPGAQGFFPPEQPCAGEAVGKLRQSRRDRGNIVEYIVMHRVPTPYIAVYEAPQQTAAPSSAAQAGGGTVDGQFAPHVSVVFSGRHRHHHNTCEAARQHSRQHKV